MLAIMEDNIKTDADDGGTMGVLWLTAGSALLQGVYLAHVLRHLARNGSLHCCLSEGRRMKHHVVGDCDPIFRHRSNSGAKKSSFIYSQPSRVKQATKREKQLGQPSG
jgi:hypothetical protein